MPKSKVDFLFKHAVIVTLNPGRDILWDGAIALRAKKIIDVGPSTSLIRKYEGKIQVDARQKLILTVRTQRMRVIPGRGPSGPDLSG